MGNCIASLHFLFNLLTVSLTAASLHTLISSVRTVIVSITLPALRHTHVGAWTLESLRTAGFGFCNGIM